LTKKKDADCIFNDTLVIDKGMMQFYCDMVSNSSGELFKANLFEIIQMSKQEASMIELAASNSITILNQAGVCFAKRDFGGIRVPGANLCKAFFSAANLSGADLTGCILTSSFL